MRKYLADAKKQTWICLFSYWKVWKHGHLELSLFGFQRNIKPVGSLLPSPYAARQHLRNRSSETVSSQISHRLHYDYDFVSFHRVCEEVSGNRIIQMRCFFFFSSCKDCKIKHIYHLWRNKFRKHFEISFLAGDQYYYVCLIRTFFFQF